MTRTTRIAAVLLVVAIGLVGASRAQAACHSFTVTAPNTVTEGNRVPVKIERDAAINPSSVRVTTVSGTAEAPSDFKGVNQRVEFTNETSRTITVETVEDGVHEQSESFTIRLSEGQGCPANPNFQYGPPERVTISDDDPAPATTAPPTAAPPATTAPPVAAATTAPPTTTSPSPSTSVTPSATPSPTTSPTITPLALPIDESDDGFPWVPVALGAAIVAAGAGALVFTRLRRGVPPGV